MSIGLTCYVMKPTAGSNITGEGASRATGVASPLLPASACCSGAAPISVLQHSTALRMTGKHPSVRTYRKGQITALLQRTRFMASLDSMRNAERLANHAELSSLCVRASADVSRGEISGVHFSR